MLWSAADFVPVIFHSVLLAFLYMPETEVLAPKHGLTPCLEAAIVKKGREKMGSNVYEGPPMSPDTA